MQASHLQSLTGVKILITRSEAENRALSQKLAELGARTFELPTIEIIPPESWERVDRSIRMLSTYDWIIFTSANGVHFFGKRMEANTQAVELLRIVKVAAIGPATAAALERLGKKPDYVPEEFLSEQIARGLGDVTGLRILLPRAEVASEGLPRALRSAGAEVDVVVAYRTVIPNGLSLERLREMMGQGVDVVTFTSPSTVRNLAQVAGPATLAAVLRRVKVACIGPVTAKAVRQLGVRVDMVAASHSVDGLVKVIVDEIGTL